jgi:chromosome segregation ATPase
MFGSLCRFLLWFAGHGEYASYQTELEQIKIELYESQTQATEFKLSAIVAKSNLESYESGEIQLRTEELDALRRDIERIQGQLRNTHHAVEVQGNLLNRYICETIDGGHECARLRERIRHLRAEKSAINAQVVVLNSERNMLNNEMDMLKRSLKRLRDEAEAESEPLRRSQRTLTKRQRTL